MIEFLIKSTLAMGVLLGLYYILFEREKMHRFNRFYLLTALVFSFALPFITIPVYVEAEAQTQPLFMEQAMEFRSAGTPQSAANSTPEKTAPNPVTVSQPSVNYWLYIGWGVYLLVVLILTIRFAVNIARFYILKRNNLTVSYKGTSLVLLNYDVLPHTFLGNIYLSKKEYESKLIAPELFTHELVHVNQFHTLDVLFVEMLKTIFWFNPLLYFYKRAIQLNHEFLADEKVIGSTANTAYYQNLLLEKAAVGKTFSIASNLNFALTKKRFIMMTKTTRKGKSILLKAATLPAFAVLLYFLSTQTVAIAKTPDAKAAPVLIAPEITALTPEAIDSITDTDSDVSAYSLNPMADVTPTPVKDTDPEARKNRYFSGVRVVILDEQEGKYIDLPYEMLTAEQRYQYLPFAPEKMRGDGISDDDYQYALHTLYKEIGGLFYLDDKKVTREEILKHKKSDFASFASKSSGMTVVNGKLKGSNQNFFYTRDYYNKNLKNVNDHYPDKTLKITRTKKPGNTWLGTELTEEEKKSGKSHLQLMSENRQKELEADYYPTVEKIKKDNLTLNPYFPGGYSKFEDYVNENLNVSPKDRAKRIIIKYTINTNGILTDASVRDEDEKLAAEVKRVLESSPKWIPAQQNGKPYLTSFSTELDIK